ncbi:hypothetical protein GO491_05405 [Flavobacteriaceae bacterium Ap0902]|nr:hypothetical protein [Flavobacteriaceae bacterium Ap0902]
MIIPRLFRWLFFRNAMEDNVFDAVRKEEARYIDTSINLGTPIESIENASRLNEHNLEAFAQSTPKDTLLILYGNHKKTRMEIFQKLKETGFNNLFEVGTIQDLKNVQDSI